MGGDHELSVTFVEPTNLRRRPVATVGLISAYAGMVFKSLMRGLAALIVFGLLYGLIYILMRMEDYALLVGAVSAFLTIAAVMILTRNLNWYGDRDSKAG